MAIENRNLAPDTILIGTYKKQTYLGKTLEKGMEITDGPAIARSAFKSLSAAATAIRKSPTNGYLFWTVQDDTEPASVHAMHDAVKAQETFDAAVKQVGKFGCSSAKKDGGACGMPALKGTDLCWNHTPKE